MGVVYLGADVPLDSWIEAARTTKARAIVIGIPTGSDRASAAAIARQAVQLDDGLLVAIGGPASAEADVPARVLRLPEAIGISADTLAAALRA